MRYLLFIALLLMSQFAQAQNKQITLENILKDGTFRADYVQGFSSMQDGEHYTEIEKGELVKKSFSTGRKVATFDFYSQLKYKGTKLEISSFEFNEAENKMLIFTEPERIFRRSALYKVYVYDIENKQLDLITGEKILHASFSPQGDKVAFVRDNNLFYKDLISAQIVQITQDGGGNIINGNCDWVYEEEFGFTKAFQWSPDGNYLAFYRFDQTKVPAFTMMYFKSLYPTKYEFKYPKAGDPNSTIKIGLYDLKKASAEFLEYEEEYIPRIKWTNYDNKLVIYTLNRHQNQLRFYAVNPKNLRGEKIYEENNKYYVDINDEITFLQYENAFVHTSEKSGYNHIYYYDINSREATQITSGNWDVSSLLGVDEKDIRYTYEDTRLVYYMSSEQSPLERNLYSINIQGNDKKIITPEKGTHNISFSKKYKYFVDNYSNVSTPNIYATKNNTGETVRVLNDNTKLKKEMAKYELSQLTLITVKGAKGDDLNAWIIKPTNMQAGKQYPLIMYQYSGPGSQSVSNSFAPRDYWWYQMLAQQGYVIACVDGRGTGSRGEEFKKMTYQQLGKYESDDQIAAAQSLARQYNFIDKDRIGIWGWSYGGYMSSICITKGADIFKSAVAVAPVTSWRYYDNIYTERYMRTPQENPDGYDDNSPINMVDKLKGNYLLIHGSGDDNVHYQNTMEMMNAMIDANAAYDSEIYPNRNHSIYGGNTRYHLYKRMTDFWLEKL